MNPFLPLSHCIPDGEAHVFGDRCYLYGSCDRDGRMDYCSHDYHVFSAPVTDLEHWTDHGVSFSSHRDVPWSTAPLYAPDVLEKDGRYHLFFCLADGSEGVAVSDRPEGPFHDAVQLFYPPEIHQGRPLCHIDPAVFSDDDGSVYYYWGQFQLQAARLQDNLRALDGSTYTDCLITEERHWFHEGASMRKFRGNYYLLYCSVVTGRANTLDYAMSKSPLGPFTYCGSLVNNRCCDPESWNIHGSMEEIDGQLYLFYHRSSRKSCYSRRACVERLQLQPDGTILPAEQTSLGFSEALPLETPIPAMAACDRVGSCYFAMEDGESVLRQIRTANRIGYRFFRLPGTRCRFSLRLRPLAEGCVQLRFDSPTAPPAAVLRFRKDPVWQSCSVSADTPRGLHSLYLDFHGSFYADSLCELGDLTICPETP